MSKRFFVHVYRNVRSKFLIEANDHKEAMEKADAELHWANERLSYDRFTAADDENLIASQLPSGTHIATEDAEETLYYLIDEVGDEEYERTKGYLEDGQEDHGQRRHWISARERDTILAALRLWQHAEEGTLPLYNRALDLFNEIKEEIAEDSAAALTPKEIDDLCERVNC